MIGIKGIPFTDSFEWIRWSRSAKELKSQGATEILTDEEARVKCGDHCVRIAKTYAMAQSRQSKQPKVDHNLAVSQCPVWIKFVRETFRDEEELRALLQAI